MATDMATPTEGAIVIPEATGTIPHDTRDRLDKAVADLAARKDDWVALDIPSRIRLLEQCIRDTYETTDDWVDAAMQAKGIAADTPAAGEDLAYGPMQLIRTMRLIKETLEDLDEHGEVQLPGEPYVRPDGQVAVPVFPTGWRDKAMYPQITAELRLQRHVTLGNLQAARSYREKPAGRVCFVLGAGNVSSAAPIDVVHKLFVDQQVCILKMNPVNEYMGPIIKRAIAPLLREGFVRVVHGGAADGQYLVDHPDVDTLHMTGSDKTHDIIVYGTGDEGATRKTADDPLVDKPFTSELGNVTPVIVVPGPWTAEDLAYQGKHIASMLTNNAGFNCACPRMIVQHASWNRRHRLLDAVRASLAEAPQREAYYPGARDRWDRFVAAHPEAEWFGDDADGCVPWTLLADLDPDRRDDIAFRVEAFNGLFGEVALDAPTDIGAYLERAVEFCNETLWGTLAASIIVHPATMKDPASAAAVEKAIDALRYGTVAVNAWAAMGYGLVSTSWAAFPGHARNNVQSGIGHVHNTFMLDDPEKSVIRAPWKLGKKPPASYDFKTLAAVTRRMIRIEAFGDVTQLPGIVVDGIRG